MNGTAAPDPSPKDLALYAKLHTLAQAGDHDTGPRLLAAHVAAATAPWKEEVERYRMQLLAIMSAYAANHTPIPQGHLHWSQCYEDVRNLLSSHAKTVIFLQDSIRAIQRDYDQRAAALREQLARSEKNLADETGRLLQLFKEARAETARADSNLAEIERLKEQLARSGIDLAEAKAQVKEHEENAKRLRWCAQVADNEKAGRVAAEAALRERSVLLEQAEARVKELEAWKQSGVVMAEADKLEELIQLKLENPGMTREAALAWALEMRSLYSPRAAGRTVARTDAEKEANGELRAKLAEEIIECVHNDEDPSDEIRAKLLYFERHIAQQYAATPPPSADRGSAEGAKGEDRT